MEECVGDFMLRDSTVTDVKLGLTQRRSERLPTVHCDCVSCKMAEFSFARRAFTVFLCDIFTGLES